MVVIDNGLPNNTNPTDTSSLAEKRSMNIFSASGLQLDDGADTSIVYMVYDASFEVTRPADHRNTLGRLTGYKLVNGVPQFSNYEYFASTYPPPTDPHYNYDVTYNWISSLVKLAVNNGEGTYDWNNYQSAHVPTGNVSINGITTPYFRPHFPQLDLIPFDEITKLQVSDIPGVYTVYDNYGWPSMFDGISPPIPYNYLVVKFIVQTHSVDSVNEALVLYAGAGVPFRPADIVGDPVFTGLQGQTFQFHGLTEEIFSLVSSPNFQVNAVFKYISNGGPCHYNNTPCWSHPGNYLGDTGILFGPHKIIVLPNSYKNGLYVEVDGVRLIPLNRNYRLTDICNNHIDVKEGKINCNDVLTIRFYDKSHIVFQTTTFIIELTNSDEFLNLALALNDKSIIIDGMERLKIPDTLCNINNNDDAKISKVSSLIDSVYKRKHLIHGLLGQTWKNIEYCGNKYYEGDVDDYVVSGDLLSTDHTFSLFASL